jgi:hypothetical protein
VSRESNCHCFPTKYPPIRYPRPENNWIYPLRGKPTTYYEAAIGMVCLGIGSTQSHALTSKLFSIWSWELIAQHIHVDQAEVYIHCKLQQKARRVCYSNVTHRIPHIGAGLIAPIPDYRIKAFERHIDVYAKPSCLAHELQLPQPETSACFPIGIYNPITRFFLPRYHFNPTANYHGIQLWTQLESRE